MEEAEIIKKSNSGKLPAVLLVLPALALLGASVFLGIRLANQEQVTPEETLAASSCGGTCDGGCVSGLVCWDGLCRHPYCVGDNVPLCANYGCEPLVACGAGPCAEIGGTAGTCLSEGACVGEGLSSVCVCAGNGSCGSSCVDNGDCGAGTVCCTEGSDCTQKNTCVNISCRDNPAECDSTECTNTTLGCGEFGCNIANSVCADGTCNNASGQCECPTSPTTPTVVQPPVTELPATGLEPGVRNILLGTILLISGVSIYRFSKKNYRG